MAGSAGSSAKTFVRGDGLPGQNCSDDGVHARASGQRKVSHASEDGDVLRGENWSAPVGLGLTTRQGHEPISEEEGQGVMRAFVEGANDGVVRPLCK